MSYQVLMERTSDGLQRLCTLDLDYYKEEHDDWGWWTSGNYACDCNRFLVFERAGGDEPNMDDDLECSDGKYKVLKFILPDGQEIEGPDVKV